MGLFRKSSDGPYKAKAVKARQSSGGAGTYMGEVGTMQVGKPGMTRKQALNAAQKIADKLNADWLHENE
jgi:hypothetical protein